MGGGVKALIPKDTGKYLKGKKNPSPPLGPVSGVLILIFEWCIHKSAPLPHTHPVPPLNFVIVSFWQCFAVLLRWCEGRALYYSMVIVPMRAPLFLTVATMCTSHNFRFRERVSGPSQLQGPTAAGAA